MTALFIWASLVPPLPMLGFSVLIEGPAPFADIAALTAQGWIAVVYVALLSTVLGYSIWGTLLARHPAAAITPFALLIPVVGLSVAALVLGETVSRGEAAAAVVVLAGLALAVLGPRFARQ
jgi:O-acetylserine/cysteine efflux transporter